MSRHATRALQGLVLALVAALTTLDAQRRGASSWPQWHGPDHTGVANATAPLRWSDRENVRWKLESPGRCHSTPVVWGDRIYLTTAVPTGRAVQQPQRKRYVPDSGRGWRWRSAISTWW